MFKRENRLLTGIKFNNSLNFFAPQFVLKAQKNGLILNRFGIIVSKKIDKRAVARNRIKRMFRSALIELSKNMFDGYDILFIIRVGVLEKTKEENQMSIKNALAKLGVMKMRN